MSIYQKIEQEALAWNEFTSRRPVAVALDNISYITLKTELAEMAQKKYSEIKGLIIINIWSGELKVFVARGTRTIAGQPTIFLLDEDVL